MSKLLNEKEDNEILKSLAKYYTSRIDLKNFGNDNNSIEIIENSDSLAQITTPNWFNKEKGKGIIIQSNKLSSDLKIKCINDGILNITLRGLDIRDKEDNRFPVYIDYTSLIINDKEYITENKLIWHDEPFKTERKVKDNELITIHVEWQPFSSSSLYENKKLKNLERKVEKLTDKNTQQKEKIKELKSENKKMKRKLKEISNSSLLELRKIKKEV